MQNTNITSSNSQLLDQIKADFVNAGMDITRNDQTGDILVLDLSGSQEEVVALLESAGFETKIESACITHIVTAVDPAYKM